MSFADGSMRYEDVPTEVGTPLHRFEKIF